MSARKKRRKSETANADSVHQAGPDGHNFSSLFFSPKHPQFLLDKGKGEGCGNCGGPPENLRKNLKVFKKNFQNHFK